MKISWVSPFLACFWLLIAVGVFVWQAVAPNPRLAFQWNGGEVSFGWLALIMALYNFLRWWILRMRR